MCCFGRKGGGGGAEGSPRVVKRQTSFLNMHFFNMQILHCRPPKRVLHLVRSAISTDSWTALKVPKASRILGKGRPVKEINFYLSTGSSISDLVTTHSVTQTPWLWNPKSDSWDLLPLIRMMSKYDYNSDHWEPDFLKIIVTWQLRVTVDNIRTSCNVWNRAKRKICFNH